MEVIKDVFSQRYHILEVGSGTGQHAVYFAEHLPHCQWQPSDQGQYLDGLSRRLQQEAPSNVLPLQAFDVFSKPPEGTFDGLFTANTSHIMPSTGVERLFEHLSASLADVKTVCIYGPFNDNGDYTSASNQAFDANLRARDANMGLRDRQWIEQLAEHAGFTRFQQHPMPANNQLLVFER